MCPYSLGRVIERQLGTVLDVFYAVELPFDCIDLEEGLAIQGLYAEGESTPVQEARLYTVNYKPFLLAIQTNLLKRGFQKWLELELRGADVRDVQLDSGQEGDCVYYIQSQDDI